MREFRLDSAQRIGDAWLIQYTGGTSPLPATPSGNGKFINIVDLKAMLAAADEHFGDDDHMFLLALFSWYRADPTLTTVPGANVKGVEIDFSGAVPQPVKLK